MPLRPEPPTTSRTSYLALFIGGGVVAIAVLFVVAALVLKSSDSKPTPETLLYGSNTSKISASTLTQEMLLWKKQQPKAAKIASKVATELGIIYFGADTVPCPGSYKKRFRFIATVEKTVEPELATTTATRVAKTLKSSGVSYPSKEEIKALQWFSTNGRVKQVVKITPGSSGSKVIARSSTECLALPPNLVKSNTNPNG